MQGVWRMQRNSFAQLLVVLVVASTCVLAWSCMPVIARDRPGQLSLSFAGIVADGSKELKPPKFTNTNPYFVLGLPSVMYAQTDVPLDMSIMVGDPDDDTVNVTWEWGDSSADGTNSTPPASAPQWVNQTHTWSVAPEPGAGDYYVLYLLNVTLDDGMGGLASAQKSIYVYVPPNMIPFVNLAAPVVAYIGDTTSIEANASDPEGDPLTWTFVFNDGASDFYTLVFHTSSTPPDETVWNNITYVFGVGGNYTIRLNVSDALPPFDVWPHNISATVHISVVNNSMPLASTLFADPSSPVIGPVGSVLVNFTVETMDIDGDVITATWDFGDGSPTVTNLTAGGTTVYNLLQNHSYTDAGYYNVTVSFSDGRPGHDVLRYLVLYVASTNLPPSLQSLGWSSPSGNTAYVGAVISFTVVISDPEQDPIELVWNFSDGSPLVYLNLTDYVLGNVTSTVDHAFTVADTYYVSVEFTDNKVGLFEHNKTGYVSIDVVPDDVPPVAAAGDDQSVAAVSLVMFNGTGSSDNVGIANYTWKFIYDGSEVTLYGPEPSFTFLIEGVYLVTLNVTDAAGNYATDTVTVTVGPAIPEFTGMLLPVGFMLFVFVLLIARRKP